jgi:hypothetical protein
MPALHRGEEKPAHFVPITQVGHASGDGAGAHRDDLLGLGGGPAETIEILIGIDSAAHQKCIHLREILGRENEGHIGEAKLPYPFRGIQ